MKFNLIKYKPKQIKGLECLNCGQPLLGNENFCSYCGQKNTTSKLSFGNFIGNLFSGFFSYDSRFWKTFIPLLTKPGKVSKDYVEGKRVRFVNPFQLYLNVSIIYFLILGVANYNSNTDPAKDLIKITNGADSLTQNNTVKVDSVLTNVKEQIITATVQQDSSKAKDAEKISEVFDLLQDETKKEKTYHIKTNNLDSISVANRIEDFIQFIKKNPNYYGEQVLDSLGYPKTFWNKFYVNQVVNVNKNIKDIMTNGSKSYIKKLTSYVSVSLFIFLPIFTLFLKLLYVRSNFTYMEHLVFVFNTQTVFFLLYVVFYLLNFIIKFDSILGVLTILFLIYLYKALRNFYKQGRFKTFVKFIILNGFYLFLAGIGFVIVSVLSFLNV